MYLSDLALTDFRSHGAAVIRLEPGVTTFVGGNGQGKTNIVEAVAYLATLASHRVAATAPLVRRGAEQAVIRAKVVRGARAVLINLVLAPGKATKAELGRAKVKPAALLGVVKAVAFTPEDLALVKTGPEVRRRYLDELLIQMRPALAGVIADYEKVKDQRTALLKMLGGKGTASGNGAQDDLAAWDSAAARLGGRLTANRMALVEDLAPEVARVYGAIAGAGEVSLNYEPTVPLTGRPAAEQVEQALLAAMAEGRARELERGAGLVGPHREDLAVALDGFPARGYASHGESWSLALALRLGSFELMRRDGGDDPLLILDDVFAELDAGRRAAVTELVAGVEQVLVTAAVQQDVPDGLTNTWFHLTNGEVLAGETGE